MCCSNSTLYFPLIKAWMKWNPWGAFVKHLLWCGWRWSDSVIIGGRRRARKGKPGGVASQESHALTGNPEMQHKRWPPLPGITRPKLCWFQSSTLWIVLAFFLSHPPRPPLLYRVIFGMVILTQNAIDRFGHEMNWSQDALTRAVVHFRTTNAAACLRSRGFRSTLASSSLAVCAMTAEQLSG